MDEGLVVVLFTDVEGSTELSTRRGDAAARDMLRTHEELVRAEVAGHEGRVAGGRGDGFLVTFRSARRALACAVGIQRVLEAHADQAPHEHVRVRIGLNVGEVSQEQGELYGAAVNAAARICAQGSGRQIMVASVVKELAGTLPGISFLDRGWVRLRGFLEDTHLYEVAWRRETARDPGVSRTPLVGRETEMATLHELVQAARGGRGALVMVGGEPGVGKTRLAEEVTTEAAGGGMLALTGRCYEMAGSPPYLPFIELLEAMARTVPHERFREALSEDAAQVAKLVPELHRLFPEIPPPLTLPAEHERRYLFNSVRDFIQRAGRLRPLLLVLEDLHWADDATLALLRHLTETVRDMPVLILGTYRDVEVNVRHPLADVLHDIARRQLCRQIAIGRLLQEDVAAMVGAMTGQDPPVRVVAAIHDETEGNPFFIEEVVRYLADEGRLVDAQGRLLPDVTIGDLDVPHSVRFVIGRRLARLSEGTQRALTVAAVVGRGFDVGLLQAMGEADSEVLLDAIDEAEQTHMVVPVEGGRSAGYRFAHELIRQTLMAGISQVRRQRLHLQAAEALLRLNDQGVETEAVEVAHHLVEAGPLSDRRRTVRYLTVAADHAVAAAAFEDGLHHLRTALSLLPEDDRSGHAVLLEKQARALHRLGQWDEALDAWRDASTVYEERRDLEAVGRVFTKMAMQLSLSGRDAECREAVEHGLGALREGSSPWRVRLLALRGSSISRSGSYEAGGALTGEAVDLAEVLGAGELGGALGARCAHHLFWGELSETLRTGLRGAEICRSTGHLGSLAHTLGIVQVALMATGRLDEATRLREELQPIASRLGRHVPLLVAAVAQAMSQATAGDLEAADRCIDGTVAMCRRLGVASTDVRVGRATVSLWRGSWDQAVTECEEASREEPYTAAFAGVASAFGLLVRAYRGEWRGVRAVLEEKLGTLPARGQPRLLSAWTSLLVLPETLTVIGARKEAARFYPFAQEALARGFVLRWHDMALVQTVAGICAAGGGDWTRAEDHYRTALRQAEELPHRIAQSEVRRWLAHMLISRDARGDRDQARELLLQAMDGYGRLGMPRHREMTEVLLETLGERVRRS
ncbi:MAG: hypothetical protein JWM18_2788 [Chloroflexi bacterium]|jgi:class 3 adenylate cyclase/tetratricopeptide (TPR) repeat protein|nr:hypothetical protein [Chloroflexota bacterium]